MQSASPTEFELLLRPWWVRAQAGDEAAYAKALSLIAQRLRAYLRQRMLSTPDEVEDMVQEILLSIHVHRGSCDPAVPVSAWVQAIARHRLIDAWRRRGRRPADVALPEDGDVLDAHDGLTDDFSGPQHEAQRDVHELLGTLPPAQRHAIELTRLAGLTSAEAAAATGASESAIKVQVHRGLKRLAERVRGKT
ncbi:MAG: sigma-70 family RNA polymerase sigma factor [Roseateles sp.]|uniref:sigma-70 family RNA polymerase sigma factor n=1 Tax=Roseateles sp. TaxID=1971397 RepID=UPI004036BBD1